MDGYIYLYKSLLNWDWFSDSKTLQLFVYCLLKANYSDKKWKGIIIKRGSFISSYPHISKETGLSVQNIRTSLGKLTKSTCELTCKTTNRFTLITVVNYDKFQPTIREVTDKVTHRLTDNQQTTNRQLTTTNKEKGIIKNKKELIYSKKFFKNHSEEILEECKEKYQDKNCRLALDDFLEAIEIKDYGWKNYKLAFFKWVREDKYEKYTLRRSVVAPRIDKADLPF